jgi:16S rRNA (cytosine967-C5)-methyltransferase
VQMRQPATQGDARLVAINTLLALEKGKQVQEALDTALRLASLSQQNTALCTEMVYGFLRAEIRINWVLQQVLPNMQHLPRAVQLALGLAVYSLLFLEKIPHYAVLDWTVGFVRQRFGAQLAGLGNAALRSVLRLLPQAQEQAWYMPQNQTGGKKARLRAYRHGLALWYSLPDWIVDVWFSAYGEEAALALLQRSCARPWSALRVNRQHAHAAALLSALQAWASSNAQDCQPCAQAGFAFASGTAPQALCGKSLAQWHEAGAIRWQAAGSQAVLEALGCHTWQEPVWDACAGQGGKSLFLLENSVPVRLASDVHAGRLRRVARECARLSLPTPALCLANMGQAPVAQWQGNILLDVPCTGLGTIARRPDIKRHRSFAMLKELCAVQAQLLDEAWRVLLPQHELAYITCALDPQENEEQIAAFCQRHADAELCCTWQTPHTHPWLEGMYGARLVKKAQ